jgi:hypothetical protein
MRMELVGLVSMLLLLKLVIYRVLYLNRVWGLELLLKPDLKVQCRSLTFNSKKLISDGKYIKIMPSYGIGL